MPTMENMVAAYGMYPSDVEVSEIVRTLNGAGFPNEQICLMLAPTHPIATVVRDANILNLEQPATAVTAGLIGWLSEFGAVVIPSIGFFIRSQAFFHSLLVGRDAPSLCGNVRTLSGLGFPTADADRLESQLQHAGFLVYVALQEAAKGNWALELFRLTGARESATLEKAAEGEAVA